MIARHESRSEHDVWSRLAAPISRSAISWRQDGRAIARDDKFIARFVAYIDAHTVRERLDSVVAGEWDLTLELLPPLVTTDEGPESRCSFKARLQILGVIREDVGTGRDYKSAATDAFKRAAVRFGIGHELYGFEQNWVQVDGDGRSAKPLDDPARVHAARLAREQGREQGREQNTVEPDPSIEVADDAGETRSVAASAAPAERAEEPRCPRCGGRMWDNRLTKRNPRAPDYKCRDRSCDGVIWPSRPVPPLEERSKQSAGAALPPGSPQTPESEQDLPF